MGRLSQSGAVASKGFANRCLRGELMGMLANWKPSPFMQASAALHVGSFVALGVGAPWGWPVGALLANHAVLTAVGLWPRSNWLGENLLSLSAAATGARQVAITIDDGPDPEITPRVLDILDAWNAKASFFCVGKLVEKYPHLVREIVRRGHDVENHSYGHRYHFSLMGPWALRREIVRAQDIIAQVTNTTPQFFRAPAGMRNPLLDPLLQKLDLKLATWTRRGLDTITHDSDVVRSRLERNLSPGDILLLHDGNCARTAQGMSVILEVLPQLLSTMQRLELSAVSLRNAA
jgi:peptidoglycan-N-acetylglucosamine deacetylase